MKFATCTQLMFIANFHTLCVQLVCNICLELLFKKGSQLMLKAFVHCSELLLKTTFVHKWCLELLYTNVAEYSKTLGLSLGLDLFYGLGLDLTEISETLDRVSVSTSFAQSRSVSVSITVIFLSLDKSRSRHL